MFEDIGTKHNLIKDLEDIISPNTIIASNTSALPISLVAKKSKYPERIIGMHYFSPVEKMPLLEIINHENTASEVSASAMDLGIKQGKTPIIVKDVPGFYVNRCLAPMLVEIPKLILDGVDFNILDNSIKNFGMPVGPITLCDEVGIDISNHVLNFMSKADLSLRMNGDYSLLSTMSDLNLLGRKTNQGFFIYNKKNKILNPKVIDIIKNIKPDYNVNMNINENEIQMRLIGKFINEAAHCLQDNIIKSPYDGDIGAVFGIGFPPHLGGPFKMLDLTGTQQFVDTMMYYSDKYGAQFEPPQILKDYAKNNNKFYK